MKDFFAAVIFIGVLIWLAIMFWPETKIPAELPDDEDDYNPRAYRNPRDDGAFDHGDEPV